MCTVRAFQPSLLHPSFDHVPVPADSALCESTWRSTAPHSTSPQRVSSFAQTAHVSDAGQSESASHVVSGLLVHVPGSAPLAGVAQPTEHMPSSTAIGSVAPGGQ